MEHIKNKSAKKMVSAESDHNKIEALESDYLYIATSQLTDAGNGLYTAIPIYKDEIIAVYEGEILTNAQSKTRAIVGDDKYFINLLDGTIMDSMHTPCFAKYANDAMAFANSTFKNNAKITLNEHDEVCIIANRHIKAGEEIFCSYGKKYWKKHCLN